MTELPTGTVTFLFADIQGSTLLAQQFPTALPQLLARHHSLLRQAIESHQGYIFQIIGDAICAAFHTAPEALAAAIDAQRAIGREPWAPAPIRVRMGVHTGAAQAAKLDPVTGGYTGYSTLARTQHVMSTAHGGQILLSNACAVLVREELPVGITLRDMQEHRLKGLLNPEHLWQVIASDLPQDFPPLQTRDAIPNNIPLQMTSFVGREQDIGEVKHLLTTTRLMTLAGPGGIGKSRLSLQAAADILDQFPDGAWFIELAPIADPLLVPQTVASALGLPEQAGRPMIDSLLEYVRGKRLLLILDNCEHLLDACRQLADKLLHAVPNIKIMATSREALGIAGEHVYQVSSLSLTGLQLAPALDRIKQNECVSLFVERATAAQSAFRLTERNAPAVAQICTRLDGIPLAIELAAARVMLFTPEQIVARLDDRFRLLTGGSHTAVPRQQTLRALIDWSYYLLSEPERTLFRRLSVFAGGWAFDAAEAVCAGNGIERLDILDLLSQLVDKSLVVVDAGAAETARYHLLDIIRTYALEKLKESGEIQTLRNQHLDFFLGLAEDPRVEVKRLEAEHNNFRAGLDWVEENHAAEADARLAGSLESFWWTHGYWTEGHARLMAALSCSTGLPAALRANLLNRAAHLEVSLSSDLATPLAEEAIMLACELGETAGVAESLTNLAFAAWYRDNRRAVALFEQALSLYREVGDNAGMSSALSMVGDIAVAQGDYERGRVLHEEALALRRELDDKWGIAHSIGDLGEVMGYEGEYARALSLQTQALDLHRDLGDKYGIARSLHLLGIVSQNQGSFEQASALQQESLALSREMGSKSHTCEALNSLADVALSQGQYALATTWLEESLSLARAAGLRELIPESIRISAKVAEMQHNSEQAATSYRESLSLFKETGASLGIIECLEGLAQIASVEGQSEYAARLFAATESLRQAIKAPLPPAKQAQYEESLAVLSARLGKTTLAALWAEGGSLAIDQAIDYALQK